MSSSGRPGGADGRTPPDIGVRGDPRRRTVRCPQCGGQSLYAAENRWRPFCSERCKTHDFGAWASERYRVASPPQPGEDDTTPGAEGA